MQTVNITVSDGKGRRICTEIKRADPAAILVIEEGVAYEVTLEELNTLVTAGYLSLADTDIDGHTAIHSYPDALVFDGAAGAGKPKILKKTPDPVVAKQVVQPTVIKPVLKG